jgi:hypothetical protein
VVPEQFLQRCDMAVQRARKLIEQAAALCETSQSLIDSSFQSMQLDEMKCSRTRSWFQTLGAIRHLGKSVNLFFRFFDRPLQFFH